VENAELVTTTLNGFHSYWDPFFQGIFTRIKLPKFDNLWTDFAQEESRLISKTLKTNDDENQSFSSHVKKRKDRREAIPKRDKIPHYNKDASKFRCYSCKKLGHYSFQCPHKNEKGKHHANATNIEKNESK
jgi:hypothetical protein